MKLISELLQTNENQFLKTEFKKLKIAMRSLSVIVLVNTTIRKSIRSESVIKTSFVNEGTSETKQKNKEKRVYLIMSQGGESNF